MKTKTIFRKAAVIILSAMLFTACGKTGPAGPQGEQGPKGDKGATGAKGATGTANVIYSDWFTPKESDWTMQILLGTNNFYYDKVAPKITDAVLKNGVVLTYGILGGYNSSVWPDDRIGQLPITIVKASGVDVWSAYITKGNVRINVKNSDNTYTAIVYGYHFRYVVIPGDVHARRSTPLPDFKDYHAVCKYYGIPE